ncbi:LapB repeat-containing protein [Listeria monocytogenes]|uniref:LapB repeat-containing protein n=1 Tax=Listeria monocytogenes TaxID=1639 RepID=UPI00077581DF|nr:LapB repeat-containing protein [Listeria monocytogenes]EAC3357105.1 LPXTG cell wall anchor domain-containing protein [Listeria monocytogenes]EAE6933728.1 LPXTG cell wall anchor domain-containing protein [Listeria monocytogenes]EAF6599652.1 LPXTG cell wall anchor domain-containing protein [Listeria monocytogenes]EAF8993763.1 LPXTG cell wall anchor domain-containing protein [Listeria monocytogenes]ECC2020632.1 LPXTG cell wall anchor domain-containing protein [Listeria monocytogenes]
MLKKVCLIMLSFSLCMPTVTAFAEEAPKTQIVVKAEDFPEGKTYGEFFPDQNLANRVAALSGKKSMDIVTKNDLDSITVLQFDSANISDISGLEYMGNLTKVDFTYCSVTDLSPLTNLTNLTYVDFDGNNNIVDLQPLAGLTNLKTLNLGAFDGNSIVDISPLRNLTNLTVLDLEGNNIVDVTPLGGLTNLVTLDIYNNEISDISALNSLTNLTSLFIGANTIEDLTPLNSMQKLKTLEARSNHFVNKDLEIINSLSSLESLQMQDNDITDLSFFNTCTSTSLKSVDFAGNHISDIRPVMTYRSAHRNLSIYDVTKQTITLPIIETKENAITIENRLFDINGNLLAPKSIDNKGSYIAPNVTWDNLTADPSMVSYTFNNGGKFSGTVNQPINYLAPELTFDSEITYTVNTSKDEATFLSDVSATTDANAEIHSNFESKVRMNKVGDYSVSIWSSNEHKDSQGTIVVHVVAAPTLPTITADPEITYDKGIAKTEAEFLSDVSASTEADAMITSDFEQVVDLEIPGDYEVTLTSTNSVGAVTTKVIIHVVAAPTLPTITADPEITYDKGIAKTEVEFLNDVSASTEADAMITSDFEQVVDLAVPGDYEVKLTSTNLTGTASIKVIVHVVENITPVDPLNPKTPDKPKTPDDATNQNQPNNYNDSTKSSKPTVINSSKELPKTGDETTNLPMVFGVLCLGLAAALLGFRRTQRK